MPVRKSAVELAASRGAAEDRPSLFSGAYEPPSISDCSAVAFGHRCAWTRTTSIIGGKGSIAKVCLVSSSCCKREGCDSQQKHMKSNGFTYQ
jgi:hypothetical protein